MRTLIVLLALLVVAGLAEQPAIAIIDLEAKLCAKELADAVSDILRTEVIGSGRFRVIERAQLAKVMEEHAFQLSGMVDASTVAEFGRLVGADYVALGSVSVLGGTYTVTLRFIDVETAEAVLGKTESTNSESGLPDVCRRLAAALTGLPYSGSSSGGYSYSSGSGGRIAFSSGRDGDEEIFVMDADGENEERLTYDGGAKRFPCFTGDGNTIIYDDTHTDIFAFDLEGGDVYRVTWNGCCVPTWGPGM